MTQEDKQLLIKDLAARLPYDMKLHGPNEADDTIWTLDYDSNISVLVYVGWRPYLRPMSSMTDEEENELDKTDKESSRIYFNDLHSRVEKYGRDNLRGFLPDYPTLDWLNAHHFDYRGLIKKGLALEAPKGMYES